MRNPEPWQPGDPEPDPSSTSRRGALIGLILVVLLVIGVLVLAHVLRGSAQVQDCALSGRSNCSLQP